jgi:hypothetical protein
VTMTDHRIATSVLVIGTGGELPPIPQEIASLMREVSTAGKLAE